MLANKSFRIGKVQLRSIETKHHTKQSPQEQLPHLLRVERVDSWLHQHVGQHQVLQAGCPPRASRFIVIFKRLKKICVSFLELALPQMHLSSALYKRDEDKFIEFNTRQRLILAALNYANNKLHLWSESLPLITPMMSGWGMADLIWSDCSYNAFNFLLFFWAVYIWISKA